MDVVSLYMRAAEAFGAKVKAVSDGQWQLPTPCTEWDVHALVNHVVGEDLWAESMLGGKTVSEVGDAFDGDLLGGNAAKAWDNALRESRAAIIAPAALDATVHASFGDISGEFYVTQLFHDHLIHGWDLARAIGADEKMDPELAQIAYDQLAPHEAMLRASGVFGEHIEVPEGANAQTKLLALTGRRE